MHNPYNPLYPAQPGYQDIYSGTRWKKHRDSKYKIQRKTRWHSFLFSCRTGFNNIVPYNATRQGMPGYELPGVLRDPLMTVRPSKEHNFAIFATYQLNPGFIGGPSRQVWQLHLRANWPDGRHCDEVRALPLPLPHRVLLDRGRRPPHHVGEDWQEPKVDFLNLFIYVYWALWVLWNNVCWPKLQPHEPISLQIHPLGTGVWGMPQKIIENLSFIQATPHAHSWKILWKCLEIQKC